MFEIIILLIVGAVVLSVIQGVRRGDVSPEERKENPTLLESVNAGLEELNATSERWALNTKAEAQQGQWFKISEMWIGAALQVAKRQETTCRKMFGSEITEHEALSKYDETMATVYKAFADDEDIHHDWKTSGTPSPPSPFEPQREFEAHLKAYHTARDRYDAFIAETNEALGGNSMLATFFDRQMRHLQLESLLDAHFSQATDTARRFLQGNASVLKSQSISAKAAVHAPVFHRTNSLNTPEHGDEIEAYAKALSIPHLVHFTRCDNLPSIVRHGLHSVESCDTLGLSTIRNDQLRLDGQLNGISLSVTFPNYPMFYKYRQLGGDAEWAVLLLSAEILWKKPCGFFKHNAADARMRHQKRDMVETVSAFKEMFVMPGVQRDAWLRPCDPADPQAEVMAYEAIEPRYIQTIAFETTAARDKWKSSLGGIDTICPDPNKGFFASRAQARQN